MADGDRESVRQLDLGVDGFVHASLPVESCQKVDVLPSDAASRETGLAAAPVTGLIQSG